MDQVIHQVIKVGLLWTIDGWTIRGAFYAQLLLDHINKIYRLLICKTEPMMDRSCINLNCSFQTVWDHILAILKHRKLPNQR